MDGHGNFMHKFPSTLFPSRTLPSASTITGCTPGNGNVAKKALKGLYEDRSVPAGVRSLASLKYAATLLNDDKIDEAVNISLLEWSDNVIAYTKGNVSLNYDDRNRTTLMIYNAASSKLSQVAQSRYFPVAQVFQNKLFYRITHSTASIEELVLTSQDLNSGAKKTYLNGRVIDNLQRSAYNTLDLRDDQGKSYELQIASGAIK